MRKISRYSGLEWRFVVDDIDARLGVLEGKPAPETCERESTCQQQDTDSLEQRVRDLECEVESLFAFQRRDHPATRAVVKETPAPVASAVQSELFVRCPRNGWDITHIPAKPEEIRAEYERLFPAEVKRAKVAEAFLHAALVKLTFDVETSYETQGELFRRTAEQLHWNAKYDLERMAAVLEAAAREQGR